MSIAKLNADLAIIQKLSDLPNATDGLSAQELKARFDESGIAIQRWINEVLIPGLRAENVAFAGNSSLNADTVQEAIETVQGQVRDASSGTIVNGSVTKEKLDVDLLKRVYGGRPHVSMNTPGSEQNMGTDFPIGQLWVRPAFTVVNAATENWVTNGCTAAVGENKLTVTGNHTVVAATAVQTLANIGQDGDRVYVLFEIQNKDTEITGLTLSLNGGEEQDASAGVFEGTLSGSTLTVQFTAAWPSTSLAGGSFEIVNYAVVNIDQAIRQTADAEELTDWPGYLTNLLPLDNYTSPEEMFVQTLDGTWWSMSKVLYPVEQGGTGLTAIGKGELLMGSGNNQYERLEAADNEESFLQFVGGKPAWRTKDDAISTLGSLRIATGSYKGTGGVRTFTLPVTPKLLHISSPSGCSGNSYSFMGTEWADHPVTLAQGCADTGQYEVSVDGGTSIRTENAKLSGSSVTVGAYLCNRSGITYNWVAIY